VTSACYQAETLPHAFQIVWCYFPYHDAPEVPGPKPRPVLISFAGVVPDDGTPFVHAHYGSSKMRTFTRACDFVIANVRDLDHCGLRYPTRFNVCEYAQLPWHPDFFGPPPAYKGDKPGHEAAKLCTLPPRVREKLIDKVKRLRNRGLISD
jgi:hypothetical protein